ncbi:hypothetical protein WS83_29520 [Burkholderia sp. MSMB2042]|nr:hypothetical protein WS78_16980 [Burkholderia savannae]KVG38800.1 hypothetical protein WS77_01500 [Burkholderia sp. MSMB0265]KVG82119.1 hypothetical protein WS81_10580 [Burkholderia sp. MSMB2040]KVG91412.1 hypothetical protein WS82_14935 [Burkholderia sp. MSMB2041]KVG98283.1 hypothetical protein WS83_29520 [Burkholderia sp. MSMB2042]
MLVAAWPTAGVGMAGSDARRSGLGDRLLRAPTCLTPERASAALDGGRFPRRPARRADGCLAAGPLPCR